MRNETETEIDLCLQISNYRKLVTRNDSVPGATSAKASSSSWWSTGRRWPTSR